MTAYPEEQGEQEEHEEEHRALHKARATGYAVPIRAPPLTRNNLRPHTPTRLPPALPSSLFMVWLDTSSRSSTACSLFPTCAACHVLPVEKAMPAKVQHA
jgi:hypothetical protein